MTNGVRLARQRLAKTKGESESEGEISQYARKSQLEALNPSALFLRFFGESRKTLICARVSTRKRRPVVLSIMNNNQIYFAPEFPSAASDHPESFPARHKGEWIC